MMFGSHKLRTSSSTASVRLGAAKTPIGSDSEETKRLKMERKVKFNPNVEIFEYNPYDDDDDDVDTGFQLLEAGDKGMSEITKRLLASHLPFDGVSTAPPASRMRTNGRYNTDLGVYAFDFSETAYLMQSPKDSVQNPAPLHPPPSQQLRSAVKFNGTKLIRRRSDSVLKPIENQSQWNALLMQLQSTEDGMENAFHPSPCQELKDVKFNHRKLNRSQHCATSVMKPIENLSQWKAAKSSGGAQSLLHTETDSTASAWRMKSRPSDYRYRDGKVNYGEEDETQRRCEIKSTKTPFSLNAVRRLPNKQPKAEKLNSSVRYRTQYLNPVLNPIENLSQWKAAIATS